MVWSRVLLRGFRRKVIATLPRPQAQYIFIHDALDEQITCGETSIQAQELRTTLNHLHKVDPNTATTGFEEQFQVCMS